MKIDLIKKYVDNLHRSGKITLDKTYRLVIHVEIHQGGIRSLEEAVTEKIK